MKIKTLLIAALGVVSLALAGCTTTIDSTIQKSLPRICADAETAHIAFTAVAAAGKLKQSVVDKEAAAYAALQPLCANPSQQTAASVLIQALTLYTTMSTALKEAQKVE